MGYTIFTTDQIAPAKLIRPRLGGGLTEVDNPAKPFIPSPVVYQPADYDRFSADPARRLLLLSDPAGTATDAEILAAFPAINEKKYARLWQAANDYQYAQISGAAIGLLTIGVLQGLPKSLVIQNWIKSIWLEYYTRKALVCIGEEPNLDFTMFGQMPYSVPELMAEVSA